MGLGQIATLFSALFELLVASKMITAPDKLLGGHVPAPGFETLAFEWFGMACGLYAVSLLMNREHASMMQVAMFYNLVWTVSLGMTFAGAAWRPESAISDGSWAVVPLVAHAVFTVTSKLAHDELLAAKAKSS
jgi:hypothetical protein